MRTDVLIEAIDEVIAETMQLFGDHDAAEARRRELEHEELSFDEVQ